MISNHEIFFQTIDANDCKDIPVYTFHTLVVGSGAAAFNAADSLYDLGQRDVAMVTEGLHMGTSRNTGSDKQTYYKLSLASSAPDSVYDMAQVLFHGGSVHGDNALVEAALSAQCFYKLVGLGVPFPHDRYGQYVGYKTDHDPMQRATSCGPLTSKYMTEHLEASVRRKDIPIFDGFRVVSLLTQGQGEEKQVVGLLAVDTHQMEHHYGLTLFRCANIIYATGGPSGLYHSSVYPPSQTCGHGAALEAGAKACNVTEWQYGIASTKFRWNLSGTYQQVIPRYISTDAQGGDAREFLGEYFANSTDLLTAVFLKGYQWPFDPRKLDVGGSSLVDIAVYVETRIRGRRVFLDFIHNPASSGSHGAFDFSLLKPEAYDYLQRSNALFGTPLERLLHMNRPAYELYLNHGIDLAKEPLEIAVCAQHNNGGLAVDLWWQSNVRHLFPVGEVCGNFGVYRPGGTALNATQVGSLRAAQYITAQYQEPPMPLDTFSQLCQPFVANFLQLCQKLTTPKQNSLSPMELRTHIQQDADRCGAFLRSKTGLAQHITHIQDILQQFPHQVEAHSHPELLAALIDRDILITQLTYFTGMLEYIRAGGLSRGSCLIDNGSLDFSRCATQGIPLSLDGGKRDNIVQQVCYHPSDLSVTVEEIPVRPIPTDNSWFETTYNAFHAHQIIQ